MPPSCLPSIIDGWNVLLVRGQPRDARQADAVAQLIGKSMLGALLGFAGEPAAARSPMATALASGLCTAALLDSAPELLASGRIAISAESFDRFGARIGDAVAGRNTKALQDIAWAEAKRAREQMREGAPLLEEAGPVRPFLAFLLLRQTARLDALESAGFRLFAARPPLTPAQAARLLWLARRGQTILE